MVALQNKQVKSDQGLRITKAKNENVQATQQALYRLFTSASARISMQAELASI